MSVRAEIERLANQVERGKVLDRRNRVTDAAAHLRQAIALLEGCAERLEGTDRVAALLVEASDLLIGEGDGLPKR